jgi:TonB family protein
MVKYYTWANEHLTAKDSLQGCKMCTVIVAARVNTLGLFDSVWVSQSVNPRLDNNAIRVLKASEGQWVSGKRNDTIQISDLQVTIDFKGRHGFDPTIQDTGVHNLNGVVYRDAGFKGGKHALLKYMGDRLTYPPYCKQMQIQGEVVIAFTIDKNGLVTSAYVKKKVHPLLDAEALRVVQLTSGYYNPRKVNSIPNECSFEVPVNFKLNLKKK